MATIAQFDASRRAFTARASHRRSADRLDPVSPLALCALIEGEIIPRLMVAHHGGVAGAPLRAIHVVTDEEVAILAPMALAVEADLILAHVEGVLARGVPLDTVLIDLMAPTARLLGEWWESDRCDFVEVTMGLWRLQEVVHEIADRAPPSRLRGSPRNRALFAVMPGDPHTFGTVIVEELFRGGGWDTERWFGDEAADLLGRVARRSFDVIGLTISCDCHIAPLASLIADLRTFSQNPKVSVMVGGRVFAQDPLLASSVGADGTARDPRLALDMAADLVRARAGETLAAE